MITGLSEQSRHELKLWKTDQGVEVLVENDICQRVPLKDNAFACQDEAFKLKVTFVDQTTAVGTITVLSNNKVGRWSIIKNAPALEEPSNSNSASQDKAN
jgi:hypothetical protein